MIPYEGDRRRREEEYADLPPARDDGEKVYPDGSLQTECWNSSSLRRPVRKPVKEPVPPDEEEAP